MIKICHSYLKMRQSKQFRNATPYYPMLLNMQDSIVMDTQARAAVRVELVRVAQPGRRRMARAQSYTLAFSTGSLTSLGDTPAHQRLPPSGDDGRILRKIRLSSRLGAAFLITAAHAAIGNAEHVIRLSASTRATFAALLLTPSLQRRRFSNLEFQRLRVSLQRRPFQGTSHSHGATPNRILRNRDCMSWTQNKLRTHA
ncbi:hypothetical protein EV561_14029 [Rhizobium sp. BK376]|nr:hypothetical protein EV561_14029 [Rhizobium sp. BK376]